MIYYDDKLLDLRKPITEVEKEVAAQIEGLREQYFGAKSKKVARLLWPNGARTKNESGFYELPKIWAVELRSPDMMYRYSPTKATLDSSKNPVYTKGHEIVKDGTTFYEKDLEIIWYLKYQSIEFAVKQMSFEDMALVAKAKVSSMAEDTELRFYLMGKSSPIANSEDILRSMANAFGVLDVHTLSLDEIKVALYDVILDGEKKKDRICNYETFVNFTQAPSKHKNAAKAREAVKAGDLYWNKDDFAWFLKGSDSPFLRLKGSEVDSKESILIDAIITSPRYATELLKYYGEEVTLTADEVRNMKRPDLNATAKLHGVVVSNSDKNPEIVDKIIEQLGLS